MNDSMMQRQFKERDVQRMRNIITKDYSAKTGVQVGYTTGYVERKEGDVWEENGKQWTIKNGLKQTVTRFDDVKRRIIMPLTCPNCKKPMTKGQSDKYMYSIHQMCLDCVIDHEAQLKKEGKFDEYQLSIIRQGARVHIKEMEDVLLELLMEQSNDSFVTEDGDIETWKGNDGGKQQLIQEIQEYIQKLKDAVGSQYL
jgi:hypothetical protein